MVVREAIEDALFKEAEYNKAFVLTEYLGHLRRDPDRAGYEFWLDVLNKRVPGNYRSMVCAFLTSDEYQRGSAPLSLTATRSADLSKIDLIFD